MTWNDLIARLNEIPEERREEKAIFCDPDTGYEIEIDDVTINDGEPLMITDENLADDKMAYMLTP